MKRIVEKFVPRLLQNEQKQHRFNNSFKRFQTFYRMLSLAPFDFFCFPKMKIKFKGRRFDTVKEIQGEMHTALNHFQDAFENWQKR
jgi:hypothetical protein